MTDKEARNTLLLCLTAAQVMQEALDDLKETDFYKHTLKNATVRFQKEIEKTCNDQINNLFNLNEDMMRQLQNGIEQIAKQIVESNNPTALVEFGKILERRDW